MKEIRENPPAFVKSPLALEYFHQILDKLEENDVPLKSQDSFGIGTMALNFSLIDEAQEELDEKGMMMIVEGDRGRNISKVNPALAAIKDAQSNLRYYTEKFQMTPQSRGKGFNLSSAGGKKDDDGFGDL